MKKFMKKLAKKTEGFTLVELIVVIAILGILAGVAVPAYSGYLSKAKDAAVITELDAIQTAATAANATSGAISMIEVEDAKIRVSGTSLSTSFFSDFKMFYNSTSSDNIAVTDGTSGAADTIIIPVNSIGLAGTSYADGAKWLAVADTDADPDIPAGWSVASIDIDDEA